MLHSQRFKDKVMKIRQKNPLVVFLTRNPVALARRFGVISLGALLLAGCATPDSLVAINDPYETVNRRTHAFNKGLDKALLRPVSGVYADVVPSPLAIGVSNFSKFLDLPGEVVNNVLQLNLEGAVTNTVRFAINGTVGFFGLYDAASEVGVYADNADFGQTLHKWGVGEGAYLELPVMGASTTRDTVGIGVDALFNPLAVVLPGGWKFTGTGVKTAAMIGDRARFATTVDSVLYESADSYSQSRLFYLQSRRHELGMRLEDEDYFDPYEDLYE